MKKVFRLVLLFFIMLLCLNSNNQRAFAMSEEEALELPNINLVNTLAELNQHSNYQVTDILGLDQIRKLISKTDFSGITFYLTTDIQMGNIPFQCIDSCTTDDGWTTHHKIFNGTFDGMNHTIDEFYSEVKYSWETAFIYCIGKKGTLKNLNMNYAIIREKNRHGCLINIATFAVVNKGKIINCHAKNTIVESEDSFGCGIVSENKGIVENCSFDGKVNCYYTASGICKDNYGKIINCINKGKISGGTLAAGIANMNESASIINCLNTGDIYCSRYDDVAPGAAGIVTCAQDKKNIIKNCINKGKVTSKKCFVGGIVADIYGEAQINNCINYGEISCKKSNAGGIVGYTGTGKSVYSKNSNGVTKNYYYKNTVISWSFNFGKVIGKNIISEKYPCVNVKFKNCKTLKKTKIISTKKTNNKYINIKYQTVDGAKGYFIVISTDKKFKNNLMNYTTKQNNFKIKNLERNKVYYIKVCPYVYSKDNKKIFGNYSKRKSFKM